MAKILFGQPRMFFQPTRGSNKFLKISVTMDGHTKRCQVTFLVLYLPVQYTGVMCYPRRSKSSPADNPVFRYCGITYMDAKCYSKPECSTPFDLPIDAMKHFRPPCLIPPEYIYGEFYHYLLSILNGVMLSPELAMGPRAPKGS